MHTPFKYTLLVLAVAVSMATAQLPISAQATPPFEAVFPSEVEVTKFANDFGDARSGGRRHAGNDLFAPKMTQVYAIADGVVVKVLQSSRAGRYMEIDHGGDWSSRYMHLNNDAPGTDNGRAPWSLTVVPGIAEGVRVRAGQHIAWVGDSGNAETSPSHTHFELNYRGRPVNPYPMLIEAHQRQQAEAVIEERAALMSMVEAQWELLGGDIWEELINPVALTAWDSQVRY